MDADISGKVIEAGEELLNNSNASILGYLPPELLNRLTSLITLLKITGIIIMVYIAFLIVKWLFGIKRHREINKTYKRVCEIDRKLDFLLKRKEKKVETNKKNKKEKKK